MGTNSGAVVIESHFTHPKHPLYLVDIDKDFECDGCSGPGHGRRYRCSDCTFDLHERCATCPSSLSCGFHPDHTLTLVFDSASPRSCTLCGDEVAGLYYTCCTGYRNGCSFNIHPLCTELPASVNHALHPNHLLVLQQSSSTGCCLACGVACHDRWRYSCSACGVDAHLECALGQSPPPAFGLPASREAAVGWCTQPPPPPQQQPTVMYYQNGCLYVVPAGLTNPFNASNSNGYTSTPIYLQSLTYSNNNCYNYYPSVANSYPVGQQLQQLQQPGGYSTPPTSGNGLTMKRVCSLIAIIACRTTLAATLGIIC
ncbi:hypothetical protein SAY87_007884 [Trapa incisa]|uniref:DC1 domain-containing protein n=1 Tax=Trapa incisa TaxID=236973 RepID=A0AAN7KHA1_9MYRT|nr:hypothetical protein SAY87_007884 [Trapa incisa]